MNGNGNWIVFFFKEKITLKHLKIIKSSKPRIRLENEKNLRTKKTFKINEKRF